MRPHPPWAAAGSPLSVRLEPISPKPTQHVQHTVLARDKSTVNRYFQRHGITDMLRTLTEKLIVHLPNNPAKFMREELGEQVSTDSRAEEVTARGVCYLRAQLDYQGPEGKRSAIFSRPLGANDAISRQRAVSEAVDTLRRTFWGPEKEHICEPLSDREAEVQADADEAGTVFAEFARAVGAEAISLAEEKAAIAEEKWSKKAAIAEEKAAIAETELKRLKRQLMERGHIMWCATQVNTCSSPPSKRETPS